MRVMLSEILKDLRVTFSCFKKLFTEYANTNRSTCLYKAFLLCLPRPLCYTLTLAQRWTEPILLCAYDSDTISDEKNLV